MPQPRATVREPGLDVGLSPQNLGHCAEWCKRGALANPLRMGHIEVSDGIQGRGSAASAATVTHGPDALGGDQAAERVDGDGRVEPGLRGLGEGHGDVGVLRQLATPASSSNTNTMLVPSAHTSWGVPLYAPVCIVAVGGLPSASWHPGDVQRTRPRRRAILSA